MNPSSTQLVFSTSQAIIVFFGLLASAFGVAFTLGRFSKSQELLAHEVRGGFTSIHKQLAVMTTFREESLQYQSALVEWKRTVDGILEDHERKLEALRQ